MTSLTVGICAYNEAWNIANLLENILHKQNLQNDAEIIVVCSGCTDSTPRIVNEFARRDKRVKLIEEPKRLGKAKAVNEILGRAKGSNIIFVSADVMPSSECFQSLADTMRNQRIGIACGKPVPVNRGRQLIRAIVGTLWGYHNWQLERLNDAGLLMHASEIFCIRKGIASKIPIGMVNDDAYLAVAAKGKGFRIKYVPASEVQVYGPSTVSDYLRQRRRIIAGHYQVRKATGKFSQYLFYSLISRPCLTLRVLVGYLVSARRLTGAVACSILEVIANLLALYDLIRRKSYAIWPISVSTKSADLN